MKPVLFMATALLLTCSRSLTAAPVTYTYTGLPLTENSLGLTQLTASFTLDRQLDETSYLAILPPGGWGELTDTSAWLLSWSMSDGRTTLSSANGDFLAEPWNVPIILAVDGTTGLPNMWHLLAVSSAAYSAGESYTGEAIFRSDTIWGNPDSTDPLQGPFDTVVWQTGDGNDAQFFTATPDPTGWTMSVPEPGTAGMCLLGGITILAYTQSRMGRPRA